MIDGNKVRSSVFLNIVFIVLFALISLTPLLSRSLHPLVPFGIFVGWVIVTVLSFGVKDLLNDGYKVSFSWLVLILWQILLSLIGYSSTNANVFISRISIYSLPIVGVFCVNHFNVKELKLLFFLLTTILLFNLVDNIRMGGIYEIIQIYGYEEFLGTNIGKTNFVACMTFFSGLMLISFFLTQKKIVKCLSVVIAICASIYVIFINSRATATILLILLTIGIIHVNMAKRDVRLSRMLFFITIILIVIYSTPSLLNGIYSILPERTAVRLMSISQTFEDTGEYTNTSFSSRIDLLFISLRTWLSGPQSFFIGIGEDMTQDGSLASLLELGIGQHSQFADFLAMYGIVGAIMLFRALKFTYLSIITRCTYLKEQMQVKVLLFVFVLESVFNNSLFAGEMFVLAIMLPALVVIANYNDDNVVIQ